MAASSLNDPGIRTGSRKPGLLVLLDGRPLPGVIEAEVTNNNHYQADIFSASFHMEADAKWWEADTVLLDIQASPDDGKPFVSMIVGEVSSVGIDLARRIVRVDGRDLTSRFIETKTQETFRNQTSSQVATTLAGRHGMTADVVATTGLVGRYYVQDHDHLKQGEFTRTTTEWDLLTYLAGIEGYDVWVEGTTLKFKPTTPPDATPWLVDWSVDENRMPVSNAMDLDLSRNLTLAKDIIVEVKSWNSRKGSGFTKIAKAAKSPGTKGGKAQSEPQKISIIRPNLTEDQAQKLANSILADESKHERVIRWKEPAEAALTPRSMCRLTGTGTSWDQTYFVSSVQRRISLGTGFTMTAEAKNHSPQSTVTLR